MKRKIKKWSRKKSEKSVFQLFHAKDKPSVSLQWTPVLQALKVLGLCKSNLKFCRKSRRLLKNIFLHCLKCFWICLSLTFNLIYWYNFCTKPTRKNFTVLIGHMILVCLRFIFLHRLPILFNRLHYIKNVCVTPHQYSLLYIRLLCCFIFFIGFCNVAKSLRYWTIYADIFIYQSMPSSIKMYFEAIICALYICMVINFTCLPMFTVLLYALTVKSIHKVLSKHTEELTSTVKTGITIGKVINCASLILRTTSAVKSINDAMSPILFLLTSYWVMNIFYNVNKMFNANDMPDWFMAFTTVTTIFVHYGQLAYVSNLATITLEEFEKMKMVILKTAGNDQNILHNSSALPSFELLIHITEWLKKKISVKPLGIFSLDNTTILSVAGIVITYGTIMLQSNW